MMRRLAVILAAFAMPAAALAQTHVVKKSEPVVRAVGVFEWTGDQAKPTASRLVPVSLYIDGQLEDAGIYMARPVPFALYSGTVFEVQKAGVGEGMVQLAYERHLEGNSGAQFDDGWMGYGIFKPNATAPVLVAKKSGPLPQVVASGGSKPRLGNRTGDVDPKAADADPKAADESGRPTMRRRTDSPSSDSTGAADATAKTPASDDPDRPTMRRRSDAGDTSASDTTTSDTSTASVDDKNKPTMRRRTNDPADSNTSSTDSSDEADRPTLKKRTPAPQGKGQKRPQDQASVANAAGSLNDDPDRPTLQRGTPSSGADMKGIPPLNGLPVGMGQRVAVSDAANRPEHDFSRPWDSAAERADVLAKMEAIARDRLAKYDMPGPGPAAAAVPVSTPVAPKPAVKGRKAVVALPHPAPVSVALGDEQLRGFTLSYGGAATFVYTASTLGVGGAIRYVSVVAQREAAGEPKVALASVTDSVHLDRTPWMRLVDVVDAEASNRASLLFEMRGQHARQFCLYRVIGASAEQVFQSGTTE